MRYVLVKHLKPGMVVARPFYNKNLNILLNEGKEIEHWHITSLERIGQRGIYIHDEFSNEIQVVPIIDDKSKLIFAGAVNEVFEGVSKAISPGHGSLRDIIKKLIEQVTENQGTIVNMLDLKQFDDYTFQHSINVCILAIVVGIGLNYNEKTLENLALSAVYHDIGKLRIPLIILNKPGKLDEREFEIMKQHPALGVEYLKGIGELNSFIEMGVLHHHERFDGTGYPAALRGKRISEFARIIALVDAFDAITSKRSYKEAYLPSEAIEYIMANANIHFDYDIAKIFLSKVAAYPEGLVVELSNGLIGIVVKNYENFPTRPTIKVISKNMTEPTKYIHLHNPDSLALTVTRIVA